ncbi:MAG: nuclease A inhibitor family protein [Myxococcota bacterium]|jgi:hypothetical protein|nr:nuclease A inhibitor family protein [Myxococcota bacterium]
MRWTALLIALALVACDDNNNTRPKPEEDLADLLDVTDADLETTPDLPEDTQLPDEELNPDADTETDEAKPDEDLDEQDVEDLDAQDDEQSLPDSERVAALLEAAVEGLWWTSESDYPLQVVIIPGAALPAVDVDNLKEKLATIYEARPDSLGLEERVVEHLDLDTLLLPRIEEQEWWDDEEREAAAKLEALRQVLLQELSSATAFRVGPFDEWMGMSGDIDVFMLGASEDGALVGVWTVSIET